MPIPLQYPPKFTQIGIFGLKSGNPERRTRFKLFKKSETLFLVST
jgi:hypothetical protein